MPEVEVPDSKEVEKKAGDPFMRTVALCVAVYAVVLAITALGGNNAGRDVVMAQLKASNQSAYYQASVVRENMYRLESDRLNLELTTRGVALPREDRQWLEEARAKYWRKVEQYKEDRKESSAEVRRLEGERDVAARRGRYFDSAEVLLQIAIVLALVAMLSGRRSAFYASLVLTTLGLVPCINGYGLFLKVPGLG